MSAAEIIAACDECHRGYVGIAYTGVKCRFEGCEGTIRLIKPIPNVFRSKTWCALPNGVIEWLPAPPLVALSGKE